MKRQRLFKKTNKSSGVEMCDNWNEKSTKWSSSKSELAEKWISELEEGSGKIMQSKEHRKEGRM